MSELPELVSPISSSILVIVELSRSRDGVARIVQVQASNAPRVLDVGGASLQWLGSGRGDESRGLLLELQAHAQGEERGVLLSLLGLNASRYPGEDVVEFLERVALESKEPLEAEGALTGLSFYTPSETAERIARIAERAHQLRTRRLARAMLAEEER